MTRVLVCGGRDFTDTTLVYNTLDELRKRRGVDVVIEGDARGADRMAGYWARKNQIRNDKYPANWHIHGRSAGYRRNADMLEDGRPDLVVAFPGGKGIEMMVRLAREAGVEVVEVSP